MLNWYIPTKKNPNNGAINTLSTILGRLVDTSTPKLWIITLKFCLTKLKDWIFLRDFMKSKLAIKLLIAKPIKIPGISKT